MMKIRINLNFLSDQKISSIYDIGSEIAIYHPINEVKQFALKVCCELQRNNKSIIITLSEDDAHYLAQFFSEIIIGTADSHIINWCAQNLVKIEMRLTSL